MERHLASIQVIKSLEPIPGADNIERAQVLGWYLVVKKGEFSVGDKCIYIEVDSICPEKPEYEFLRPRGFRVKTIRLRKQVSQGLALPMSLLPDGKYNDIGTDVTELLEITKYIPNIPAHLSGKIKGPFPSFISKTDEIRIQSVPNVLTRHYGKLFIATEKVDGSSMTCYYKDGDFGVCSRNLDLVEDDKNSFWKVARELDLENKLKSLGWNVAIQGELLGQGIQKNKYKKTGLFLYVFNVFNIDEYKYLNFEDAQETIEMLGLTSVPVLGEIQITDTTVDDLVRLSEGDNETLHLGGDGKSLLNRETLREGVVLRPYIEQQDEDLGRLSFKVINPKFLLKYEE